MLVEKLETEEFRRVMRDNISKTIEYMFNSNQEFGVSCEVDNINFTPELPVDIIDSFSNIIYFMLVNYSFESASIDNEYLSFEAGFGTANIGALVQIPLLAIKQIFIEDTPILINIVSHNDEEEEEEIDSMSALLNNPENAKLLKKR